MTASIRFRAVVVGVALASSSCTESPQDLDTTDIDRQATEWTMAGLLSKNASVRQQAFAVCKRNWNLARDHARDMVSSDKVSKRMASVYLFAHLGSRDDLPLLRKALGDSSTHVCMIAVQGVDRLNDKASAPGLAAMLESGIDYERRRIVLDLLVRLDRATAVTACLKLADHEEWAYRRNAAQTMAKLEDDKTADRLQKMLGDAVWMVKSDAAQALGARRVATARPAFLKMLKDDTPDLRKAAVIAIAALGQPDDLALVAGAAHEDKDKYVRIAATKGLGNYPEDRSFPILSQILQKKGAHRKVRFAAVQVLRRHTRAQAKQLAEATVAADSMLRGMDRMSTPAQPNKD